MLKFQSYPLFY